MKYQNFVFYLVIPLALFSIPSLLENVQAQTNSTNQTQAQTNSTNQISQQQNQNMNLIAQALMKVNIFEIKDNLMKAKLAIVDGHFLEALTGVRDVETELLLIEPSPTKFLNDIHKAIYAIARSDIDKSLDTLTKIQFDILKAENQIFKAAVADPQMMQQVKAAVANPQMMQQFNSIEPNTNEEEDSNDIEEDSNDIEEDSNDIEDSKDARQQLNTMDTIIDEEEYYTDIEDT
jgi:hypothetical protein